MYICMNQDLECLPKSTGKILELFWAMLRVTGNTDLECLRGAYRHSNTRQCIVNLHILFIVTDNHLETPLEKVNKEVVFRNPTVRTLLNKSTLRTLPHLEPSLTIIYNIYIYMYIYICNLETQIYIYIYMCDFGSLGYAENLCRGTIKMLNTHQILYIYIRNRTVRTPPKTY